MDPINANISQQKLNKNVSNIPSIHCITRDGTSTTYLNVPNEASVFCGISHEGIKEINTDTSNDGTHKKQTAKNENESNDSVPRNISYRDYSSDSVSFNDIHDPSNFLICAASDRKNQPFPVMLHYILCNKEYENIINWLPHGRSWKVLDTKAFENKIIPKYFRHAQYSSFLRQVNGWGFNRVSKGSDVNSYYHEFFLQGLPHLCFKMRRLEKKSGRRKLRDDNIPNFYEMSEVFPLPEYVHSRKRRSPSADVIGQQETHSSHSDNNNSIMAKATESETRGSKKINCVNLGFMPKINHHDQPNLASAVHYSAIDTSDSYYHAHREYNDTPRAKPITQSSRDLQNIIPNRYMGSKSTNRLHTSCVDESFCSVTHVPLYHQNTNITTNIMTSSQENTSNINTADRPYNQDNHSHSSMDLQSRLIYQTKGNKYSGVSSIENKISPPKTDKIVKIGNTLEDITQKLYIIKQHLRKGNKP